MSKKIKLIIATIITIFTIVLLAGSVSAFSPANQTPIYPQVQGGHWYFCKEKGGPIRFTQYNPGYNERVGEQIVNEDTVNAVWSSVEGYLKERIRNKLKEIAEYTRPIPSNSVQLKDYNGDFTSEDGMDLANLLGPKVAMTPVLNPSGSATTIENTRTAYTFSSGSDVNPLNLGFKKGNYTGSESDTANESAIQASLWNDPTFNEGKILAGSSLYTEALDYENWYKNNNIGSNYDAKINANDAQVIANRTEKTYIIGPYKVTYPEDNRFSYIEDLYVVTDKSSRVEPIEILFESKSADKPYPSTGETFFVKFSAAGNPTKAGLHIDFAYIQTSKATYQRYSGTGDIYQFYGEVKKDFVRHEYDWQDVEDENGNTIRVDKGKDYYNVYGEIKLKKVGNYRAQIAAMLVTDERIWTRKSLESNIDLPQESVDLTMELGGYVWEDAKSGKESVSNGKYNKDEGDRPIPNMLVTLYRQDGTQIATTRTDANGRYLFQKLDAMYQYYVKFTYNGQYYQPVTFADSTTWGTADWQVNSNAKDIRAERESYNVKFEKIGSSPANYKGANGYNKTYTKQELLSAGVIDEFGNLIGGSGSMAQYVQDCMIDAYTNADGANGLYPVKDVFVIDTFQYPSRLTPKADLLYPSAYYINLGVERREESDLAIKKDVEKVTLEINGQTHTYTYDTIENKENAENQWDISVRLSDAYYNTNYSRELYKSDYIYKASMYGERAAELGKTKNDELQVYVTYKIMVRNQAMSIQAKVDELVDYYDQDLEYVDNRSYIEIKRGENQGKYAVKASSTSRYEQVSSETRTTIAGYDNLYVTGLDDKYLTAGQTAYVYLTFRVKKDTIDGEDWIKLDEELVSGAAIGVGKENIVEVNGYSTRYAPGTQVPNVGDVSLKPAGIVDKDSNSGNLNPSDVPKDGTIKYENFEDDTDKAPNIRIILYRNDDTTRVISGSVWEDERNKTIEVTTTGDGIRNDKETLINGVTVQLVELMENGTEFVWREFGNGAGSGLQKSETPIINYRDLIPNYEFADSHDGQYAFKSFVPGKYVVRFIYGDTIKTVAPSSLGGANEKSYNGQDYKSTTYQEGIEQGKEYVWRKASTWNMGQETLGEEVRKVLGYDKNTSSQNETFTYLYDITESDKKNNVSDAKDIESRRNEVINYSNVGVTNYIAEVLASHKADYTTMNDRNTLLKDLMANTNMKAETGVMVIELEYDQIGSDGNKKDNSYKITNVDLGLEERAKTQLSINKEVANVKLTLSDGRILFDAQNTAQNVLWRKHEAYKVGYKGNLINGIEEIRNSNKNKTGLIQLSMDEELMHGATITITYQVTVTNEGEVDYKDNCFYYTGKVKDRNTIVTTKADQVLDYVANNLQFNALENSNWRVINKNDIASQGLVNSSLKDAVEQYNTIIITDNLGVELIPTLYKEKVDNKATNSTTVPLVLTQTITSENSTDDLTYSNIVEIVKTSNTVGRRNEYSVVGNQDPTKEPQELDSDKAEVVKILPPFGDTARYITIGAIIIVAIAVGIIGIIFIKKKILVK